jgi:transcriptional regulator with GAF, ATPase, and Fis domain
VTRDPVWTALLEDLPAIAATPYPVLLEGESGTGKELMARAVHSACARSGAWMAINCAAVPRDLFESELFGHARGAFSGAQAEKAGLFELAAGGSLFLDEVGEMPLELQAKLLRVLDDGEVRRIGEVRQRQLSVKIIAATNRPLEPMVAAGQFRADLYHRLAVHALRLRPLRERPGDIEVLARYFLQREGLEAQLDFTPELLADLEARPWHGNARELRNYLVRAATQRQTAPAARAAADASLPASLRATRSSHERRVIEMALAASGGNVTVAARSLRLHVTTLRRKMRALGVGRPA